MEKLSKKLNEIGQDLKSLINTSQVLDENERLLDNQDLAFLLKVSFRTLQRYRLQGPPPTLLLGIELTIGLAILELLFMNEPIIKLINSLKKPIK